jgi:SMC interacting uncharacterized protein involved in chromosome segregation
VSEDIRTIDEGMHNYMGLCPDVSNGPNLRDPDCPVCQALNRVENRIRTLERENRKFQDDFREMNEQRQKLCVEIANLKSQHFVTFANEECWIWQGDGEDNLRTLTCPVVISPGDLAKILGERDKAIEELTEQHDAAEDRLARMRREVGEVADEIDKNYSRYREVLHNLYARLRAIVREEEQDGRV